MLLEQCLLLLCPANVLNVRKKRVRVRAHMISSAQKEFSIERFQKCRTEEKWRSLSKQACVAVSVRGKRAFFIPAERAPVTASGSMCLLQVSQAGRATQESCLIVNASRESWWLFQIAGISFTAVGRMKKTSEAQHLDHSEVHLFLFSVWD